MAKRISRERRKNLKADYRKADRAKTEDYIKRKLKGMDLEGFVKNRLATIPRGHLDLEQHADIMMKDADSYILDHLNISPKDRRLIEKRLDYSNYLLSTLMKFALNKEIPRNEAIKILEIGKEHIKSTKFVEVAKGKHIPLVSALDGMIALLRAQPVAVTCGIPPRLCKDLLWACTETLQESMRTMGHSIDAVLLMELRGVVQKLMAGYSKRSH